MADDVNNAGTITVRAYAPTKFFPLVGAAYSGLVAALDRTPTMIAAAAVTRTWNSGATNAPWGRVLHNRSDEQSLFPKRSISAAVMLFVRPIGDTALHAVMTRQWNGIGGVGYLPSFPQLDQHNTTWPHAS